MYLYVHCFAVARDVHVLGGSDWSRPRFSFTFFFFFMRGVYVLPPFCGGAGYARTTVRGVSAFFLSRPEWYGLRYVPLLYVRRAIR